MGLPPGCSEPRPLQMNIRVADEVLAILAVAALENEQIDKGMAAMGNAQNFEGGGKRCRDTRKWIKVRSKTCHSLERVAHGLSVLEHAGGPQVQVQRLQGNRTGALLLG